MSEQPTGYDLYQDEQIRRNAQMIKPDYTPFDGPEYSFPVVGQGISAQQYRLMSLGQANGIIHGDNGIVNTSPDSTGYRYYLDGHATDSETNSKNTLILRAGTSAEAILEGFYHRLTEDMEISFPPVTTPTTYHVCLTYDPSRETERTGPIYVKRYDTTPPTSGDRVHLVLHTVHRNPNELLSNAQVTRYRHYTAGVVSAQNENQLPDPASFPAGTLAVPSAAGRGIYVRANTSLGWVDPIVGPWLDLDAVNSWAHRGGERAQVRRTSLGIQFRGALNGNNAPNSRVIARMPSGISLPNRDFTMRPFFVGPGSSAQALYLKPSGDLELRLPQSDYRTNYAYFDPGQIIPTN